MMRPICAAAIAALFLSACGGGASSGLSTAPSTALIEVPSVGAAQGLYTGSDANGNSWNGFVLASGAYDFVFLGADGVTLGLIRGTALTSSGKFTSNDTKKYEVGNGLVLSNMISANYTAKSNIVGHIAPLGSAGLDVNFSLTYNTAYEQPASIAAIVGTYTGPSGSTGTGDPAAITIAADGSISGQQTARPCGFTGALTPHTTENLFDVTMTFNGTGCLFQHMTLSGFVSVTGNTLIVVEPTADQSDAFVMLAQK